MCQFLACAVENCGGVCIALHDTVDRAARIGPVGRTTLSQRTMQTEQLRSYQRLLPSANFSYDIAKGFRVCLAASQAISRPTFGELSSAKDYSAAQSNTPVVTDAGNPNLQPVSADQADISFEYYPNRRIALTLAGFYKHLTNFVTTQAVAFNLVPTNQVAGAPASFPFTELTYVNGDSATVYGIEAGAQYFFENGLGFQTNATYNRARAKREGLPTTGLQDAVPFSANAKVFY